MKVEPTFLPGQRVSAMDGRLGTITDRREHLPELDAYRVTWDEPRLDPSHEVKDDAGNVIRYTPDRLLDAEWFTETALAAVE